MRLLFAFFGFYALLLTPASALFCSEPSSPYCARSYDVFDDQTDFDSCRREMNKYADEVNAYLGCLRRASQTAVDEYNDAVESFNDRADG